MDNIWPQRPQTRYKIYLSLWKYSAWQSIFYLLTNAMSMPWSSAQWIAWRPLPRSICCPASPRCCWCWPVSPRCWCWPPPASPNAPPPCTRFGLTYFWYRQIFFLSLYTSVPLIDLFPRPIIFLFELVCCSLKQCWFSIPPFTQKVLKRTESKLTSMMFLIPLSCWYKISLT